MDQSGKPKTHGAQAASEATTFTGRDHRFGLMFDIPPSKAVLLTLETCRRLGDQMTALQDSERTDSAIPAGYTYFGQFVDHDLSFDRTETDLPASSPDDVLTPTPAEDLLQARSPALDLDSLYAERTDVPGIPSLFVGPRFKIGRNSPKDEDGQNGEPLTRTDLDYDLPRFASAGPGSARAALIADPRNDENLAVAQTHLMWLKFHNHIVDHLQTTNPDDSEEMIFMKAKQLVVRHYQHVVLHDFVQRFIDTDVFKDVIVDGKRKFLASVCGEIPFMPLEFSVAAFRMGHSQVRETYTWNSIFDTPFSFRLLFLFSQGSGNLAGNPSLPADWITDFRRLYDFGKTKFRDLEGAKTVKLNSAKAIDPKIAAPLGTLPIPEDPSNVPFTNLASLNLRKGSLRGLASGQDMARAAGIMPLTADEIANSVTPEFATELRNLGFLTRTPAWLYVLIEAAVAHAGERMGKLGSTIVAETFLTMVMASRITIISPTSIWTPAKAKDALGAKAPLETIPEILLWMDAIKPIVDPLRDKRT